MLVFVLYLILQSKMKKNIYDLPLFEAVWVASNIRLRSDLNMSACLFYSVVSEQNCNHFITP
jgi:hypothetical protein